MVHWVSRSINTLNMSRSSNVSVKSGSRLSRYMKAPLRMLIHARNLYVRSMTSLRCTSAARRGHGLRAGYGRHHPPELQQSQLGEAERQRPGPQGAHPGSRPRVRGGSGEGCTEEPERGGRGQAGRFRRRRNGWMGPVDSQKQELCSWIEEKRRAEGCLIDHQSFYLIFDFRVQICQSSSQ